MGDFVLKWRKVLPALISKGSDVKAIWFYASTRLTVGIQSLESKYLKVFLDTKSRAGFNAFIFFSFFGW
jgi:hypothetical protein